MRIDAYMQVSQIYQANKTKNAPKTGKAGRHRWQQEPILYQLKMSQTRWQMHCFLNDIGGYTFG